MIDKETRSVRSTRHHPVAIFSLLPSGNALILLAMVPVMLLLIWTLNLERTLPEVRAPRSTLASEVLPGHGLIGPGFHEIGSIDADLSGEWIVQEIGESNWLATDQEGARQRIAFYGSEIHVIARVGPEAGRAYISVNGRPVDLLPSDDFGSFVGLWAGQASNRTVLLASGLAHGEHVVEIQVAGNGEVAIAGYEAVAQTPFPWAFALAYSGLSGGMFMILRLVLSRLSSTRTNPERRASISFRSRQH